MKMCKIIIDLELVELLDQYRLPDESYNDVIKKLVRVHTVKKVDEFNEGLEGL